MINIKEIWNMTLKCIEDKIPQKIYENYFDDVKLLSLDKNIATVVVPNELSKTLLEGQYKQNLQDSLLEVTETLYDLKFILLLHQKILVKLLFLSILNSILIIHSIILLLEKAMNLPIKPAI